MNLNFKHPEAKLRFLLNTPTDTLFDLTYNSHHGVLINH